MARRSSSWVTAAASAVVLVDAGRAAQGPGQLPVLGHPGHLEVAEGLALAEGHLAQLAQLEQGQEVDDDLDPGGQVAGQVPERGRAPVGQEPASSCTVSDTVTVSTVTWERSTWGAGRSAVARR